MDAVEFGIERTSYHGRKEKVAIVMLAGRPMSVGLAQTARCCVDLDNAKAVLETFAVAAGVPVSTVAGAEHALQEHCRTLTKWKPRLPRY